MSSTSRTATPPRRTAASATRAKSSQGGPTPSPQRARPVVIGSLERLKKELELVDALGDMEVASKLISASVPKDAQGNPVNPLDAHFRSLELSRMEPIAHGSREFGTLQAYARDTHGATHRDGVEVLQAFRVERCVPGMCLTDFVGSTRRRRGTRLGMGRLRTETGSCSGTFRVRRTVLVFSSRVSVLHRLKVSFYTSQRRGHQLTSRLAPVTGYMFGKGVYFADVRAHALALVCPAHLILRGHVDDVQVCELSPCLVSGIL